MTQKSMVWATASLLCVACFTDVGVGTRDTGNGGEGASPQNDSGGSAAAANSGGFGNDTNASRGGASTSGNSNTGGTSRPGTTKAGASGSAGTRGAVGGSPGSAGSSGAKAGGSGRGGNGGAPTPNGGTGAVANGGSGAVANTCLGSIEATPASNYSVTSVFSVDKVAVKPTPDLRVDWSEMTQDLSGRTLDPAGMDMLELALWPMDLDTLVAGLASETLSNPVIIAFIPLENNATSANLLDLQVPDGPLPREVLEQYFDVENYPPANNTYTVMLANGLDLGSGTRMIQAFYLDPASDNTDLVVDSTSMHVSVSANLHSLASPRMLAARPDVRIDWTNMRVTGAGNDFIPSSITRVDIAKFSESVPELEARFVELEDLADERYSADVEVGTSYELAFARNGTTPFPGIDSSGTWLLALSCGACQNPAPWYLTVLEPCTP